MFSPENAAVVAEKLNKLGFDTGKVPVYDKFNVQFLGTEEDFSHDSEKLDSDDFVNACALVKLPATCSLILNYIYYNNKYENHRYRIIKEKEIAEHFGICEKTVSVGINRLINSGLLVREKRGIYRLNFEVRDDKNYFYINTLWFTEKWNFKIEIKGKEIQFSRKLSANEVLTLMRLTRNYVYQDKYYKSSQNTLGQLINRSGSTAGNCIRNLEGCGMLRRLFINNGRSYDCLGVNNYWQTHYIVIEEIINLAKATQNNAQEAHAEKLNSYQRKKEKERIREAEERKAMFKITAVSNISPNIVNDYANLYLNRVQEYCKDDFEFHLLQKEKKDIMDRYNAGDIDGNEGGRLLNKLLDRQREYLARKGLDSRALEWNYLVRRAKCYLVRTRIKPKSSASK